MLCGKVTIPFCTPFTCVGGGFVAVTQPMKVSCEESHGVAWIPGPTVLDAKPALSTDQTRQSYSTGASVL